MEVKLACDKQAMSSIFEESIADTAINTEETVLILRREN